MDAGAGPEELLAETATFPTGDRTTTITYLKWAAANGVQFPSETEVGDGDPASTFRCHFTATR